MIQESQMTLSRVFFPEMSWLAQLLLVLCGTVFIAISAQIAVPMFPVPMTLQTLAILVVGLAYGARLGTVTLLAYLAEGAAGIPVFASGNAGLPYMMGPTGGFLVGFVIMAFLAGYAADRRLTAGIFSTSAVTLILSALLYIPGLLWPAVAMGKTLDTLWLHWMSPFLIGDAVKAVLAALLVTGGWAIVRARRS